MMVFMFISIQYLRAVAALMVVLSHAVYKLEVSDSNLLSWFSIGEYGVDLFFIISGFIMCHSVKNKKITFLGFMRARAERIFPLYWIFTFLALGIFIFQPSLVNSSGGETSIFSSFTLIPTGDKLLINNGWTLSFEFLFYFIFAFSVVNYSFYKTISTIVLFLLFVLGALFDFERPFIAFITSPLIIEFILGMFAYKIISVGNINNNVSYFLVFISLLLLSMLNFNEDIKLVLMRPVYAGLPMFLLFVGFVSLENKFKDKNNLLYNIGMSSYSLYLVHPFVLSGVSLFFRKIKFIDNSLTYFSSMVLISCIVGWLCFCFIEKPVSYFLRTLKGLNRNRILNK